MIGEVVAFVFARGGSKGLPGKNVCLVGGVPLVGHAITAARASQLVDRVVVSTDDPGIAAVAREYGAEVPWVRPADLASDQAPEWLAWQHALGACADAGIRVDLFVSVPATAPLRLPSDIDACIERFRAGGCDAVVTVCAAQRNPYFNMVLLDEGGTVRPVLEPGREVARRQDAPAVFDLTTVAYVADPSFVRRSSGLFEGQVAAVVVPRERALDIDDELDLELAELLFARVGRASPMEVPGADTA